MICLVSFLQETDMIIPRTSNHRYGRLFLPSHACDWTDGSVVGHILKWEMDEDELAGAHLKTCIMTRFLSTPLAST